MGLNKEMWGGQFVGLANDYRVIAYDMLGHGQSRVPAADTPLEAMPTSSPNCLTTCKLHKPP